MAGCSSALKQLVGVPGGRGSAGGTIKIGFISPQTGQLSVFTQSNGYVLGQVRAALAKGLTIGGKKYSVEIIAADSQSSSARAATVASQLVQQPSGLPARHGHPGDRHPGVRDPVAGQRGRAGRADQAAGLLRGGGRRGRGGGADRAADPVRQLFFGLTSLILLCNIYLLGQKLTLNATRRALVRELVLNERLENLSLVDPLTQLMNRRAMNEMIPREVARANRLGGSLTFMTVDITGFRALNSKFGRLEGDLVLVEFGKILRTVFRGGDVVFRQGGDEFLILMPDTNEEQADYPIKRLAREVEFWNLNSKKSYELSFSWGLAPYATGSDVDDVLRTVDRKIYQKKHNLVPVF